ncbi:MAG: IPT/TIG domain-containing protein [Acidobacteriaceae bacterium]
MAASAIGKQAAASAKLNSRPTSATTSSSGPLILYTDITSGPSSGGERNDGSYLTVFGVHFGDTQGASTVTIDGRPVAQYILWSNTKIGVQVGHVSSGPIVVSVGGFSSNSDKTFTVRSGHIYYIGPNADNSAPRACPEMLSSNSYSTPWGLTNYASKDESKYDASKMRTPYTYYSCIAPGDILVFLNGVDYPYFDGRGWHAALTPDKGGTTSTNFVTIMARPGATATLGGEGWANDAIRNTGESTYTVYSGLTLIGGSPDSGSGLIPDPNDRYVGNTIMCPSCDGQSAAMGGGTGNVALGNVVTNVSTDTSVLRHGSDKEYHAVYFQGNNFEFAWNRIYNTDAYNGFQINEDGSKGFYDFSIHDNDIADVNGSGINLSDIDPSSGYIRIYNNVIHHVGVRDAEGESGGDPHSCIAVKGYGSATGAGTAEIYNNTMYDCSSYLNKDPSSNSACAILIYSNQLNVTTNLVNNIIDQPAYAGTARQNVYLCGGGSIGTLTGSNNLWYSQRSPGRTAPVTRIGKIANPMFVSATDFHPQTGSPAIGAGIAYGDLRRDIDGMIRANPPTIGAYAYSKSDSTALAPIAESTPASYASAPLLKHKHLVYLLLVIVALVLIFIAWNSHWFRLANRESRFADRSRRAASAHKPGS